jgi:hypothetical protein
MDLVSRVKNILVSPISEWRAIDDEPDRPSDILKNYVAILAAIPAVCGFIGLVLIGGSIVFGLISAIIQYGLTLASVYVVAFVINALAPMFGGIRDFSRAFKVAAYAPTAAWVAGAFALIPALAVFMILGVYSIYLFFIGLPILMRGRVDSSVAYILVVLVTVTIVYMVILYLPMTLLGAR